MKLILLETYSGVKKILERGSSVKIRRYGTIHVKDTLAYNVWYSPSCAVYEDEDVSFDKGHFHEKTVKKYKMKKETRKQLKFRIHELTPEIFYANYKSKYEKSINYMTLPVLAYLQLFFEDALLFDSIKGLLVFAALYQGAEVCVFQRAKNENSNALRFFEKDRFSFIGPESVGRAFDSVIVAGKWDIGEVVRDCGHLIGNNIFVHLPTKEEAVCIYRLLESDGRFICISITDFFFREWKVEDNVRPDMGCDLENGYIVHGIRIRDSRPELD